MVGDPEGAGGLAWRLEAMYRTACGQPPPPLPRAAAAPEPEEKPDDLMVEVREWIEELEAQTGRVPGSNESLAQRLAMVIPWDEMEPGWLGEGDDDDADDAQAKA
jgi:hypothetical protein